MDIKKYFILASVVLMAVSCKDKDFDTNVTPKPGTLVQFGGDLEDNAVSRTIYGKEEGEGTTNNYFPIYWLNDTMIVTSMETTGGLTQLSTGIYAVPESNTGGDKDFAGKLDLIVNETSYPGHTGVKWGEGATQDFYSIYPYRYVRPVNTTSTTTASEFLLNMPNVQTCMVAGSTPVMTTADMYACFMYAKHTGIKNGSDVDLGYKPLSTALRFKLSASKEVTVQRIDLVAPGKALSGEFKVELSGENPVITPVSGETYETVSVFARYESESYLKLTAGQSIELNAFIIPVSGQSIDDTWYIQVTLSDGKQFKKTLGAKAGTTGNMSLAQYKIHRLPDLPSLTPGTWKNENWMKNIPRNVYLSEISIPGSWSSMNKGDNTGFGITGFYGGYQGNNPGNYNERGLTYSPTIDDQYNYGCRAFHLDTRYRITGSLYPRLELGVATGGQSTLGSLNGAVMSRGDCDPFEDYLTSITGRLEPNEYMVLLCTLALDSWDGPDTWAGVPGNWIKDVNTACSSNGKVLDASGFVSTYYGGEEKTISSQTTVGDVLDRVIVIIACSQNDITNYTTRLPQSSKCLFVVMPLKRDIANYEFTGTTKFDKPTFYIIDKTTKAPKNIDLSLSNTLTQITYDTGAEDEDYSGLDVTNRGYAPSYKQRKDIGNNIFEWFEGMYQNKSSYTHSSWSLCGLGGYTTSSSSAPNLLKNENYLGVSTKMNSWINGTINNMKTEPVGGEESKDTNFYPIGIQLLNRVYTEDSQSTITNILMLNNKFHKAFDPKKVAFDPSKTQYN